MLNLKIMMNLKLDLQYGQNVKQVYLNSKLFGFYLQMIK